MTKIRALTHPDGTPLRQYGQDFVDEGVAFDDNTLDAIRSLVDEEDASAPLPSRTDSRSRRYVPEEAEEDIQVSESVSRKITGLLKSVSRKPAPAPRRAKVFPELAAQEDALRPLPRPSIVSRLAGFLSRLVIGFFARVASALKGLWRMTGAVLRGIANTLLWFVWRAVVIVGVAFLVAVCVGPDKVATSLTWSYERYHETNPQIADRLRGEFIRAMSHLPWAAPYMPREWGRLAAANRRSS